MDSDKPDWHVCEQCHTAHRFGAETMVFMFRNRPDLDHILTICSNPDCRAVQVILGLSKELNDCLSPQVKIIHKRVFTSVDRDRTLSAIHPNDDRVDSFERDMRLEMLTESVNSLFPKPEKNEGL